MNLELVKKLNHKKLNGKSKRKVLAQSAKSKLKHIKHIGHNSRIPGLVLVFCYVDDSALNLVL